MEIGDFLKDRYRIAAVLGKGGMGAVYQAFDETLGVQVALKENLFEEDEYVRQFRREATILANLRHPNLPRVTDHFVIEERGQYLVMDFIEGEDLKERIDRLGVLPIGEAVMIGATICDALDYLHNRPQPILHRDIKPGNVKVTPNGEVFLVDFGLAKIVSGSGQTTIGAQGITPGFSPPEQYGATPTTPLSDIYSLAATLYESVCGTAPENALDRMMDPNALTEIRERNPNVPDDFAVVLNRAMEIQPEDRFLRAADFRQALLEISVSVQRKIDAGEVLLDPRVISDATTLRKEDAVEDRTRDDKVEPKPKSSKKSRPKALLPVIGVLVMAILGWIIWPSLVGASLEEGQTPTDVSPSESTQDPDSGENDPTSIPSPTYASVNNIPTETAAPESTPIGGGTGQIAFASDRSGIPQIWLMNVDGSNLRQVTDLTAGACQPDWSPLGIQLVFVSPCPRNQDTYPGSSLFVINSDGTGLTPLPAFPGGDFDPAWSPDGKKIAFTSLRDGGRQQIWIMDLETNETTNLSDSVAKDFQPIWAPDGNTIMFVTTRSGTEQLWFMDTSGRPWDFFTRSAEQNNRDPIWSPNGEVIIFTQSDPSGGVSWLSSSLWEDGGVTRGFDEFFVIADQTTRTRNPMREADLSPDGIWLVVVNNPVGNNREIYILTTSGAEMVRLTNDPAADFDPSWDPTS